MAYELSYRLEGAPEQTTDGSGQVVHQIVMAYRNDDGTAWKDASRVPGHTARVLVPAAELAVVMDMPHGNAGERQAKNAAYKQLLATHRGSRSLAPDTGWGAPAVQDFLANNDASAVEAALADTYITDTLGQSYPVPFG